MHKNVHWILAENKESLQKNAHKRHQNLSDEEENKKRKYYRKKYKSSSEEEENKSENMNVNAIKIFMKTKSKG